MEAAAFIPQRSATELPRTISSLYHIGGFDTGRRSNIYPVDDNTVLYCAANTLVREGLGFGDRLLGLGSPGYRPRSFSLSLPPPQLRTPRSPRFLSLHAPQVTMDLTTKARTYLSGLDLGSVGCFAMHPNKTLLAVGSCGRKVS